MTDDHEEIRSMLVRKRELRAELTALDARLMPDLLARLAATAGHVETFDAPTQDRIGGALLHNARCIDSAGARLRDALGAGLRTDEAPQNPPIAGVPLPLLLHLGAEPEPAQAETIAELGLTPVFGHGRWRPCVLYSGTVAPERLVALVLALGGDCYLLRRPKRTGAGQDDG